MCEKTTSAGRDRSNNSTTDGGDGVYQPAATRRTHRRHLFAFAALRQAVGEVSCGLIRCSRYLKDASSARHCGVGGTVPCRPRFMRPLARSMSELETAV